ncbi:hypothetical protein MCW82_14345 [Azospirillum doebereinerae]|nr:hypothetical protein [Azospirillum doebereinerae]MCG5240952.1 hypothetical protein [Azospirillum doebereinerae]
MPGKIMVGEGYGGGDCCLCPQPHRPHSRLHRRPVPDLLNWNRLHSFAEDQDAMEIPNTTVDVDRILVQVGCCGGSLSFLDEFGQLVEMTDRSGQLVEFIHHGRVDLSEGIENLLGHQPFLCSINIP